MGPSQFLKMSLLCGGLSAVGACDTPKKNAKQSAPQKILVPPVESSPPEKVLAWYEGVFHGATQLSELSGLARADALEREGQEQPRTSGDGVQLKLDLTVLSAKLSGRGMFGTEELLVSGTLDQKTVRLSFSGDRVRGSWVGRGDEKARRFEGPVRLSLTATEKGKVTTRPFAGQLVVEKSE